MFRYQLLRASGDREQDGGGGPAGVGDGVDSADRRQL